MAETLELTASGAGTDRLTTYLARLTGEPVTAATPIQLRSVHRAALTSWARKQGVPVRLAVLSTGTAFTVRDLLGDESGAPVLAAAVAGPKQAVRPIASLGAQAIGGVGVDIEEVESLPETADFREHPFFQDNFTPAEIAHAIRQGDARASLCGLWAAKEAIMKAGLAIASANALKSIEITWDAAGRPVYPGAQLSISHTPRTAVAMCMAMASQAVAPVSTPVTHTLPPAPAAGKEAPSKGGRWPWSRAKG